MLRTRFTDMLGCSVPLQQAPIGGAAPCLTAAVAEAGGLGMQGAILYPPDMLAAILDGVRAQTSGVFGVNILVPALDRGCVEGVAARGEDAVLTAAFYHHVARRAPPRAGLVHRGGRDVRG